MDAVASIEFTNESHPELAAAIDRMLRIFDTPDEVIEEVRVRRDEHGNAVAYRKHKVNTWRPTTIESAFQPVLTAAINAGEEAFADEIAGIIGQQWRLTDEQFHAEVAALAKRVGLDDEGGDNV